jgi:FkbM family methyltransferase
MRSRWKALAARLLCLPVVGGSLRLLWRGRIPSLRFRGFRLEMPPNVVGPKIVAMFFWGMYESAELRFVRDHLAADRDVVEIGASIGAVSSAIAQRLAPGRRLVCVEANPALIGVLRENVEANAAHLSVEIVNKGVHYESDRVSFVEAVDNKGGQVAHLESESRSWVPAITLLGLLDECGLDRYSLVADIEGAEAAIIERDSAALGRCDQIVIELHDASGGGCQATIDRLIEALTAQHGFELRARHGSVCAFERGKASDLRHAGADVAQRLGRLPDGEGGV